MKEYSIAQASDVPPDILHRPQGWARRDCLDDDEGGMYGMDYMNDEYKAIITELFNRGVERKWEKMSPAQMREEIEARRPGFYTYPPESKITKQVSTLFDTQKKQKAGEKQTTTKKEKKVPDEVREKIDKFMQQYPEEKGAAIADRVLGCYKKKLPGKCSRKDVMDRVNQLRQAAQKKIEKEEKRKLID